MKRGTWLERCWMQRSLRVSSLSCLDVRVPEV